MHCNLYLSGVLALILCSSYSLAEIYSSIDQLSKVGDFVGRIKNIIDRSIAVEERKLTRLKQLQEEFSLETTLSFQHQSVVDQLKHPIGIFLILDRFLDKIRTLDLFVDDVKESSQQFELIDELEKLKANETFPSPLDLNGAATGIARLQAFYDLDVDQIVEGRIQTPDHLSSTEPKMDAYSCFKLARILYHENDKSVKSMSWFKKSIDLFQKDHELDLTEVLDAKHITKFNSNSTFDLSEETKAQLADMIEYLAFSSYLDGKLRYAFELTRIWLSLDPENSRALENLDWYQGQLDSNPDLYDPEDDVDKTVNPSKQPVYSEYLSYSPVNYILSDDVVTKQLCRGQVRGHSSDGECYVIQLEKNPSLAGLKVEVVKSKPRIVRIHDIVSQNEAAEIRSMASTNLTRSGVQGRNGTVPSEYRIAKSAWVKGPTAVRVEQRLSNILGLSTAETEAIQVVNYGLGGYYGPHLDALNVPSENVTNFKSDRLLTALIYLNQVEVGGSTVFPRIGLELEPVARSAVVWYNKLRNGTNDPLALHSACPVLLGSKWIATKWFRDLPNTFVWPCKIDPTGD